MIKDITIGQYFPGESVLHHLDPRTKLLLTVFLLGIDCLENGVHYEVHGYSHSDAG